MQRQVNPEWTLQFTRDELSNEWRTEARYRRRYDGHWTWGSRGKNTMAFFARFTEPPKRRPAATKSPVPPPAGSPIVTTINFTADSKFDTTLLSQYVTQSVGAPLSTREVQSSIKSLYDTGDFRDIRVSTAAAEGGVTLTFAVFVNCRISEIHFEGLSAADRARAARETTMHAGDVLYLSAVDRSAVAIQNFLNRAGYLEATVDPETTFVREQSRATVVFHVNEGPRATVDNVILEGKVAPFNAQELIAQMHRGPGKTFQLAEARSDADRIHNYLVRRNYRKADIRFLNYTYNKDTKKVTLRYRVVVGPTVRVEVAGVRKRDVGGWIPFHKNHAYSGDAIGTATNDIRKNYQSRGYFKAAVVVEEKLVNNDGVTTLQIN